MESQLQLLSTSRLAGTFTGWPHLKFAEGVSTQILSKRSGARFDVLGLPTQVAVEQLRPEWAETASRLDAYKRSSRLFGYISAHRFLAGFR